MRTPFDQTAKNVLAPMFGLLGQAQPELEIVSDPLAGDLWYLPAQEPAQEPLRRRFGLLGRMAETPCLLEYFHDTPSLAETRACLTKHFIQWRRLEREAMQQKHAMPAAPRLWILSAGRPMRVLKELGFTPMDSSMRSPMRSSMRSEDGWPRGFWQVSAGFRMHLVVLRDLPETRETLLLRLLGAGTTARRAMQELHALPSDAWELAVLLFTPLAFQTVRPQATGEDTTMHWNEYQTFIEELKQRFLAQAREEGLTQGRERGLAEGRAKGLAEGRAKGLAEGRAKGLAEGRAEARAQTLRQALRSTYQARFGALPPALEAALAATASAEVLEQWVAPFATRTAEELIALVANRKATLD